MENKRATTIEQSKKLVELGLNDDTADMNYCNASYKGKNYVGEWKLSLQSPQEAKSILDKSVTDWNTYWEIIPAWSLSALISLLPIRIAVEKGHFYYLEWQFWNDNSLRYVYPYSDERKCLVDIYSDHDEKLKDCIDTAFEMIVYLKENKLI